MKANSPPICDNIVAVLFSLTQIIFCYSKTCFVRYNKTHIGFIFAQYAKYIKSELQYQARLNILSYWAQENPIRHNILLVESQSSCRITDGDDSISMDNISGYLFDKDEKRLLTKHLAY
jgi:hypothetical protein